MILEKQGKLVRLLLERTRAGKVDWKPTIDDDTFQVAFRDNSVRITQIVVRDQIEPDYRVSLINAEGSVVESFTDRDLLDDQGEVPNSKRIKYFTMLSELFELARRTALGSDKILDSIIDELDDEIPF